MHLACAQRGVGHSGRGTCCTPEPRGRDLSLPVTRDTGRTAFVMLAWVVLVVVAIGIPSGVWLRSRTLKPPREPYGSPVPKLDRVDRWLYDQYQLGNLDRSRVRQSVIDGRELSEPALRHAAHGLAAAMLAGQVGVLARSKQALLALQGSIRPTAQPRPDRASGRVLKRLHTMIEPLPVP